MKNLRPSFQISSEIQDFIIPLTPDEILQLERNLLQDGCRDPLVVWRKNRDEAVVVDGHNRFKICQKHNIPFKVKELRFANAEHVKLWMIENQIGRRNLTEDQLSYYRGLKYISMRKKKGGFANTKAKGNFEEPTALLLSKQFNVSESTIKRDAKFAEILIAVGRANHALKNAILTGEIKIRKNEVKALCECKNTEQLIKMMSQKSERPLEATKTAVCASLHDARLKKIRGMIIGIINRAILTKSPSELKELRSLVLKFESELFKPNSGPHTTSIQEVPIGRAL